MSNNAFTQTQKATILLSIGLVSRKKFLYAHAVQATGLSSRQ